MKILIISDAWKPQVNGVVRTLEATVRELTRQGHETRVIGPDPTRLFAFAMPFYREIKLEFFARGRIAGEMRSLNPDFVHIATEGPLGWAARGVCLFQGRPFTTSYHTRFPEYLASRAPQALAPLAEMIAYAALRRFHAPSGAVMVSTASIENELRAHKFRNLARWSRGVDAELFKPYEEPFTPYKDLPRPILLNVGRVAIEKNLRAFLDLETPGSKVVIGDGPDLPSLRAQYPRAHFLGGMKGEQLARAYAAADMFVFPSTTDTFGLVLLEAAAAGLRIASYTAPGPLDIFAGEESKKFAAIDTNLQNAVNRALNLPKDTAMPRAFALRFSWEACAAQFFAHLQAPSPKAGKRLLRWRKKLGEGLWP